METFARNLFSQWRWSLEIVSSSGTGKWVFSLGVFIFFGRSSLFSWTIETPGCHSVTNYYYYYYYYNIIITITITIIIIDLF